MDIPVTTVERCAHCFKTPKKSIPCTKLCSAIYCNKTCRNKDHDFHSLNCWKTSHKLLFICDSCPMYVSEKHLCSKCEEVFICPLCAPASVHASVCGTVGFLPSSVWRRVVRTATGVTMMPSFSTRSCSTRSYI